MTTSDEMRVGIRAGEYAWSLEIVDLETGKILPIKTGSLQIQIPEKPMSPITATATLIISELDLRRVDLKPELMAMETQ